MNKRLVTVLVFALLISGVATVVVYKLLSARISASSQPAQAHVVVAARDLQVGTLVTAADLKVADWSGALPKGASAKVEEAVNRGVLTPIYEGEPVIETRLAPKGAGGGLAATIPVGKRAVAVKVNELVGVAGFVVPGMRVDVIISGTPPVSGSNVGTMTRTVLQNIGVLSAGQKIEKSEDGKPESVSVVTLLVTPEQAEIMSLASSQTQIQLVLRNPLDTKETKTPGTATASLFSGGAPPPLPVAAQPRAPRPVTPHVVKDPVPELKPQPQPVVIPFVIEVFHGGKKAQAQFQPSSEEKN